MYALIRRPSSNSVSLQAMTESTSTRDRRIRPRNGRPSRVPIVGSHVGAVLFLRARSHTAPYTILMCMCVRVNGAFGYGPSKMIAHRLLRSCRVCSIFSANTGAFFPTPHGLPVPLAGADGFTVSHFPAPSVAISMCVFVCIYWSESGAVWKVE